MNRIYHAHNITIKIFGIYQLELKSLWPRHKPYDIIVINNEKGYGYSIVCFDHLEEAREKVKEFTAKQVEDIFLEKERHYMVNHNPCSD